MFFFFCIIEFLWIMILVFLKMVKIDGIKVNIQKMTFKWWYLPCLECRGAQVGMAFHSHPPIQALSSGWWYLMLCVQVFILFVYRLFPPPLCLGLDPTLVGSMLSDPVILDITKKIQKKNDICLAWKWITKREMGIE